MENIGGSSSGAGYAVYGGGWGRGFGNPSMGGRFSGRGFGFGGSHNLTGGPNLMYTYEVKPLTQNLQPSPSLGDVGEEIHVGSKIKGEILNSKKRIEGHVLHIEKDKDSDVKWYIVLDPDDGKRKKVDPTSSYLVDPNEENEPFAMIDAVGKVGEGFYPSLKESKSVSVLDEIREFDEEIREKRGYISNQLFDYLNIWLDNLRASNDPNYEMALKWFDKKNDEYSDNIHTYSPIIMAMDEFEAEFNKIENTMIESEVYKLYQEVENWFKSIDKNNPEYEMAKQWIYEKFPDLFNKRIRLNKS